MQGEVLSYRDFLYCIDTEEYNFHDYEDWQIEYAEAKLKLVDLPIAYRETCDVRSRGGSKTWDEMVKDLYLASLRIDTWYGLGRLRGYWYSTSEDQLDQPREYFDHILDHSFLQSCIKKRTSFNVKFKNNGKLKLTIITGKKARSGRADFVTFDEEAGLTLQKEKELYNSCIGVLSGTWFGLISHISTPIKASVFEINHDKLKRREYEVGRQFVFYKPWYEIDFLAKNKEFYEIEEKTKPAWWYRQEYCCKFELPMGAVFQNVEYGTYPDWLMQQIQYQYLCSGVDWNPVSGHWLVSGKWTPDYMNFVFTEAHDIGKGYAVDMNQKQFYILAKHGSHGSHITLEDGGLNIEYIKWWNKMLSETRFNHPDQNFHKEEWDPQGINKMESVVNIIQNGITLWCDEQRFPILAKMIGDCRWDPDSPEPKLKKDPANSPHALDAGLHAMSKKNKEISGVEVTGFY